MPETAGLQAAVGVPAQLFLAIMVILMLALPRRLSVLPLLCSNVLVTMAQVVVIAGCNFTFVRILVSVGWLRVFLRQEGDDFTISHVDKIFALWVVVTWITGLILDTSYAQFINRSAGAYDALGVYFLVRCLARDIEHVTFDVSVLVVLCTIVAAFMLVEMSTQHNVFSVLGGVPAITVQRGARLRCQGPFSHPIHAGTFGATLVPLCMGLWVYGRRKTAALGAVAGTVATITSASGGPVMSWLYGLVALGFWPWRTHMKLVRRGLLATVVLLHLVMTAPVWFLIARVSNVIGGTGWHRAYLIDAFIKHFAEWWLIGTTYTAHWSRIGIGLPLTPDMVDMTNQYVYEGVQGGVFKMVLFIGIVVMCYRRIGRMIHNGGAYELADKFMYWALGASLFGHIVALMSISYPPQMLVMYYCLLAFIGSVPQAISGQKPTTADTSASSLQPQSSPHA